MGKKPDAVFCDVFGGDFVTFAKQAAPLGYFKAINNRLVDGGEVGTTDAAKALGKDYPYGIWSDTYDPVIWPENEPPAHKAYIERLKKFTKQEYASGWAIMGYASILALAEGIKKAGSTKFETRSPRRCSASASTRRSASSPSTPRPTRPGWASSGARW